MAAGVAAVSVAGLITVGLVVGAGSSSAVPVTLTQNYDCVFPLIDNQPIKIVVSSEIPATVALGEPTGAFKIKALSMVGADAAAGLGLVGARSIEGTAVSVAEIDSPELKATVTVPVGIAKQPVPRPATDFTIEAIGETPSLSFTKPGTATVSVNDIAITMIARKLDGTPIELPGSDPVTKAFKADCTLNAGEPTKLATITITDEQWTGDPPPPPVTHTPVPRPPGEPARLSQTYDCVFPMLGHQPIVVDITADIPAEIPAGQDSGEFRIEADATVPASSTLGMNMLGATTIEGAAVSGSEISAPGFTLPVKVPITIAKQSIPASGEFKIRANGVTPSLSFDQPGAGDIKVKSMKMTMTPKKADGTPTALGTFEAACGLYSGEPTVLTTFRVTGEPSTTTPVPTSTTPPPVTTTTTEPPVTTTTEPPVTTTTEPPVTTTEPPVTTTTTEPPVTTTTEPPVTTTTEPPVTTTTTEPPVTTTEPPVTTTTTEPPVTTTEPPVTTTTTEPPVTTTTTEPPVTTTTTASPTTSTTVPTTTTAPNNPIEVRYRLRGSTTVAKLQAPVRLTGGLDAKFDPATSAFKADLRLNKSSIRFDLFGFLPVSASLDFQPQGDTTGTFTDGVVRSNSKVKIGVANLRLFGMPISRTTGGFLSSTPADISLTSAPGFDPVKGGTLSGTYTIPLFAGSPQFAPTVNALVAGPGNTVSITLNKK
ncbi:hypothetical protein SAMN05192558_104325 [Actinokineospora alba]|uniref:DUF6801 domain-containing protein n=1 Tax=Actinokineospora alba TaxID=504798 RepID=A0A1H0LXU1_9PSEU|nr:DUF6801 domain-containing protein [Actinokineospora alba]TDP67497.1 hypothetical protein C8E96_3042 [Actinokineospora alba]SDI46988.1 hypothetical protein SAMN05421871_105135 [Actinokineospora alba]SDO72893.1 hypothetical protein SAMN05192558_104325 [Actinokineospora alba]